MFEKILSFPKMEHFVMHNLCSFFNNGRSKTVCLYCTRNKTRPIVPCHHHLKGNLFLEVIKANKRLVKR